MKLIDLQCPHCGAKLSDISTDSILECPFCNSKFKIEVDIKPQIPEKMQDVGYEFEKGRIKAQRDLKEKHSLKRVFVMAAFLIGIFTVFILYYRKENINVASSDTKNQSLDSSFVNNDKKVVSVKKEETETEGAIHITKNNVTQTVYDGKYGKVTVKKFVHGFINGLNQYQLQFYVENQSDHDLAVCLSNTTSINDYQVGAYYSISVIAAGKKGTMDSWIFDSDIPDDIGEIMQIDSDVVISQGMMEATLVSIPITIDVDAVTEV